MFKLFTRIIFVLLLLLNCSSLVAQLKDVRLILPKEIPFTYYDFVQFLPGDKYFVTCGNALSVYSTETSEIIDEYELNYGAKNLSVNLTGEFICVSVNNEVLVFTFKEQKLELKHRIQSATFISGMPNSQYYTAVPISAAFFTSVSDELYVSVANFMVIYSIGSGKVLQSYQLPLGDYIVHAGLTGNKKYAMLACMSGSVSSIIKQSLADLNDCPKVLQNIGTPSKVKVRDSLMFCFAADKYFVMNVNNASVIHEVRVPKIKYESYYNFDPKYLKELNKRPSITKPDTLNFLPDEYVYDIDLLPSTGELVYATSKALKFIDPITKKSKVFNKGFLYNVKVSSDGTRLIGNGFYHYKTMRVFETKNMKLISERPSFSNAIYSANMSPGSRWMVTNSSSSAFLWDMSNFTKYAEIKDVSKKDSSFITGVFFLNDSELVVNSGTSMNKLNLTIYNIHKKKYTRSIKKGVYAYTSGFMNNEFYYCDYSSLHLMNLITGTEEKYSGMFSLAASPLYQLIAFTKELVFIPDAGKFKIVNRKTKETVYESATWSPNARVIISPDNSSLFTSAQITKKKLINNYEVDLPVNAVVRIDLKKKAVVADYANTYYPYDFKVNGNTIKVWYVLQDFNNPSDSLKRVIYSEYDVETGKERVSKEIAATKEIISGHQTSESGKYFVLDNMTGTYLKVFNDRGELVIDLADLKTMMPKLFFNERTDKLILTSSLSSLATFIDLKNKKVIGQLANATNDNYFLITSDLYYLGSKEFVKNIRFKYRSEMFSFEQFDAYLNQPHKVLRAFACSDSLLIKSYETAYLKRMKLLGFKPDANLNFSKLPTIRSVKMSEEEGAKVKFTITATKGQNALKYFEVHNNGSVVHSQEIAPGESGNFNVNIGFETTTGINRFEFIVKDALGFESPRITRFFNNTSSEKPNLYMVVIGSEKFKNSKYDLAYAVKDASDIANTMVNSRSFNKIEVKRMFNQSFSQDSVNALNSYFAKAGVNDVVMVFFAGHGYLDEDLSYYFPTYYTDFSDPKINSVAFSSFEKIFKSMKPIRKLMFIDACFSGEVDEEDIYIDDTEADSVKTQRSSSKLFSQSTALEMSKAIFSDLRNNSGATIISSAGGTEAAFEGEEWNNGLFTHCLLEGLKNSKADRNNDSKISLSELQRFVSEEVYRLSDGKQSPTYRIENTALDYELW